MPDYVLQYVYQLSDFDTSGLNEAVPNEGGARAAGTPPFQLQLNSGASASQISVTDSDSDFGEISNTGQVLTNPVTIDGVTYIAGTKIIVNYAITTDSGFEGYSITIGASNTGNNTTTAFITNSPMVPGDVYIFTSEGNVGNNSRPYSQFACFTRGTRIETIDGPIRVENLKAGQLLATADGRVEPVQLVLRRKLSVKELPLLQPIRILAGALGVGLPRRDLSVSPQHRMLVSSPIAKRMFGSAEVLIAAKKLVDISGIFVDSAADDVEYFHIVMAQHEVIFAEGAPTESFYCGENAMAALSEEQRDEFYTLFPSFAQDDSVIQSARPIPAGKQQHRFAARHLKNDKALLCP